MKVTFHRDVLKTAGGDELMLEPESQHDQVLLHHIAKFAVLKGISKEPHTGRIMQVRIATASNGNQ